jgi:hypothetical protein
MNISAKSKRKIYQLDNILSLAHLEALGQSVSDFRGLKTQLSKIRPCFRKWLLKKIKREKHLWIFKLSLETILLGYH